MLVTSIVAYIKKQFKWRGKTVTYGSELEQYIAVRQPQNIYDVEKLTRQFDAQLSQGKLL